MASIGLYFYRARYYDPALSRFTSADSIVPLASQGVQAWDRYAFVNNNPLRYNDPSGHMVRGDTDESGCSGRNPSCIIDMYSQSGDFEGMDDSLRNYVRRNPNYNIYADLTLDDSQRFFIANAQFQVAIESLDKDVAAAYGVSLAILGLIQRGNLKPGENAATIRGREAHQNYPYALGPNYDYRVKLESGLRPDAVDWQNHIVRELKPDNPRAIQRGWHQVSKYLAELFEKTGGVWTAFVDTYKR